MKIVALCVGRSALLPGGKRSAIGKGAVDGPVRIGRLGLAGDMQVDKRHHGGPEMAVHLYPLDHHAFWTEQLGGHPLLAEPGAFGGNVAIRRLDETQVRIGERFRLGSAVIEISQPRMPCATIERHFERKGMVEAIMNTGRCGWYCRVIEEGEARAGDPLDRIAGSGAPHTIREVFMALADKKRAIDEAFAQDLARCTSLSAEWREKASAKFQAGSLSQVSSSS